jgi:hypothetical protein
VKGQGFGPALFSLLRCTKAIMKVLPGEAPILEVKGLNKEDFEIRQDGKRQRRAGWGML